MSETTEVPNFQLTDDQFKILFGNYLASLEKKIDAMYDGRHRANTAVAEQNKFTERDYNFVSVLNSYPRNNVNAPDVKFDSVTRTYRRPVPLNEMNRKQIEDEIARIDEARKNVGPMDAMSRDAVMKSLDEQQKVYQDRLKSV